MRRAITEIDRTRLLTQDEQRQVEAALKLAGLTRTELAARAGVGLSSIAKTIGRQRVPAKSHKKALEGLLRRTRWPQHASEEAPTVE